MFYFIKYCIIATRIMLHSPQLLPLQLPPLPLPTPTIHLQPQNCSTHDRHHQSIIHRQDPPLSVISISTCTAADVRTAQEEKMKENVVPTYTILKVMVVFVVSSSSSFYLSLSFYSILMLLYVCLHNIRIYSLSLPPLSLPRLVIRGHQNNTL